MVRPFPRNSFLPYAIHIKAVMTTTASAMYSSAKLPQPYFGSDATHPVAQPPAILLNDASPPGATPATTLVRTRRGSMGDIGSATEQHSLNFSSASSSSSASSRGERVLATMDSGASGGDETPSPVPPATRPATLAPLAPSAIKAGFPMWPPAQLFAPAAFRAQPAVALLQQHQRQQQQSPFLAMLAAAAMARALAAASAAPFHLPAAYDPMSCATSASVAQHAARRNNGGSDGESSPRSL